MKVTALIPDDLVAEVRKFSHRKTLTEALIVALRQWAGIQKLRSITERVRERPLVFADGYSAQSIRKLNRS